MTDVLRINNTVHSWNSTLCNIAGAPFNGLLSVDWGHSRKRKKVFGMRRDGRPLGRTAGKYEPKDVVITMLDDSWDVLSTILTTLGLGSFGDAEFPILIQTFEPGIPLAGAPPVLTLSLIDCAVTDVEESRAEGIDEVVRKITLDVMQIIENGKTLNSIQRAIP